MYSVSPKTRLFDFQTQQYFFKLYFPHRTQVYSHIHSLLKDHGKKYMNQLVKGWMNEQNGRHIGHECQLSALSKLRWGTKCIINPKCCGCVDKTPTHKHTYAHICLTEKTGVAQRVHVTKPAHPSVHKCSPPLFMQALLLGWLMCGSSEPCDAVGEGRGTCV